jgi:predicted esterase
MRTRALLFVGLIGWLPVIVYAQQPAKQAKAKNKAAEMRPPDEAARRVIDEKAGRLNALLDQLRGKRIDDDVLAEVEIYAKAVDWVTRHSEWFGDTAKWTVAVVDDGLKRAEQFATSNEPAWRTTAGKSVVRAYRSKIDGSVQPYAITAPADFGKDPSKTWRLDVVLHGRDATLTEVKFLNAFRAKPAPAEQDYVQLDIYGRGNNAYRWAGEEDVFEAMNAYMTSERATHGRYTYDPHRIVLRGFSMGGAGAWHLGLHHPYWWAVIGPGAGFTTTRGYVRGLPDPLPPYVEKCLHIYDAVDYAENARMVPVVAYAGANDPQIQAAKNIEARLKPLGIPMTLLVAPDTEHRLTPEYAKKAEAEYAKYAGPGKGRPFYPERVRFLTYTLKYYKCDWVYLQRLDRHYDRTVVDARRTKDGFQIATTNVRAFILMHEDILQDATAKVRCEIDGQVVEAKGGGSIGLQKSQGRWGAVDASRLWRVAPEKTPGFQGPIDDAFCGAFLCVRGTGTPWHEGVARYATAQLDRFARNWDKYLRGKLPVKDDTAVTAEDIRDRNLILFGDPSSNCLIAKVLPNLPLTWTRERVTFGAASGDSAKHVPVLIQPNPLAPKNYLVLNSGHTFHEDAFQGTNALLYPRLGDYALLQLAGTERDPLATKVVTAGLFDEFWKLPK